MSNTRFTFFWMAAVCAALTLSFFGCGHGKSKAGDQKKMITPSYVAKCQKRAESGDATYQELYGRMLLQGLGVDFNPEMAVAWFCKAAKQGNTQSMLDLGLCYECGVGVEANESDAVEWYRKAAEQGNAEAQMEIARCYETGIGVFQNSESACNWYLKAADQGNALAQTRVAECFECGSGVERDSVRAFEWYRKAFEQYLSLAEQGQIEAQVKTATCYEFGLGIGQDFDKAKEWYIKAANQYIDKGSIDERLIAKWSYWKEEDRHSILFPERLTLDYDNLWYALRLVKRVYGTKEKCFQFYHSAAERGNTFAQSIVSIGLRRDVIDARFDSNRGDDVKRIEKEADEWQQKVIDKLQKAADKGDKVAQYKLAGFYQDSRGEYEKALDLYGKATKQGFAFASLKIAGIYSRLVDVEYAVLNHEIGMSEKEMLAWRRGKAEEWWQKTFDDFQRAAKAGDASARVEIANCYRYGKGVDKNEDMASQWFLMAAASGDFTAQRIVMMDCVNGNGGIHAGKDEKTAFKWLCRLAEQGDVTSQFVLGELYMKGLINNQLGFVMRDKNKAFKWYYRAALSGNEDAKDIVANCYEEGTGVTRDMNKAAEWRRNIWETQAMAPNVVSSTELTDAPRDLVRKLAKDMVAIPGKNYYICKYEVTQALWIAVMGSNPSTSKSKGADFPVENVSWCDCQEFLDKLNALPEIQKSGFTYRLPKEDEWSYACKAGATGIYCKLGDGTEITEETVGEVAWYAFNSELMLHPVGQKKPNAFGIYDMLGNVWEWTSDPPEDEKIASAFKNQYGGSFDEGKGECKAYSDRHMGLVECRDDAGFRLAADKRR